MRKFRMLFFALVLLFVRGTASASCQGIGFLILRSSAVKEKVYTPFEALSCLKEGVLSHGLVDYNPLTANQPRDLQDLTKRLSELELRTPRGVVIFAYSETGKFAAKLASLNPHVKGLFLMDPMDGTPPFSPAKRFPVFLDENFPQLNIPTTVLESEFGSKSKRLGYSCVTKEMGPEHFYNFIHPASLNRVLMPGLGHADFLKREGITLVDLMCGGGVVPRDEAFARVVDQWSQFVSTMEQQL